MVRDAAAAVLPFSQLGGIVLGARAAILHGVATPLAFASMIVDVTTEMTAQIAYIALGAALLSARAPRTPLAVSLTTACVIGLALAALAGALFLALQRYGHGMTGGLVARLLPGAVAPTAAVATRLDAIYRAPARVGLAAVMAIESLVYATRSAAAFIPNALGVQEAAYAVLAPLFGVGAEFGLAVSVLKRARDIAIGVPILLIWQAVEGQRALAGKSGAVSDSD